MHISLKHVLNQKKGGGEFHYKNFNYIIKIKIKIKNEDSWFQLYLKLILGGLVYLNSCFRRSHFFLLLGSFLDWHGN